MPKQRGTFIIQIDERLCKGTEGCRICISVCPEEVLAPAEEMTLKGIHPSTVTAVERCTGCGLCMLYCPDLAIVMAVEEERMGRSGGSAVERTVYD